MAWMIFEWDEAKSERTRRDRGFAFSFAAFIFEGEVLEWPDLRWDYGEARVRALGMVEELVLHVVFTDRGDTRRIISARLASKKDGRNGNDAHDVGGDTEEPA